MKPKLISFEGVDGVGKTTQIHLLSSYLSQLGIPNIATQEFSGDSTRDIFRDLLMTDLTPMQELCLVSLARAYHMKQVIEPAFTEGKIVLVDRFIDSTYAYQGYGRGVELPLIKFMEEKFWTTPKPDLTIYLDLEPRTARRDRFEREEDSFFERVRRGYQARFDAHWVYIREPVQERVAGLIRREVMRLIGSTPLNNGLYTA
jgi:dTMP kinase